MSGVNPRITEGKGRRGTPKGAAKCCTTAVNRFKAIYGRPQRLPSAAIAIAVFPAAAAMEAASAVGLTVGVGCRVVFAGTDVPVGPASSGWDVHPAKRESHMQQRSQRQGGVVESP